MGMSIQVNDFQWEPGKNDAEYIKLLESSRDEWQKIAQKAISKLKTLSKTQEPATEQPKRIDLQEETKAWLDEMDAVEVLGAIANICQDWDGYRTADGLGGLINEVWAYAKYCADRLLKAQETGKVNVTITQSDGWKECNCPFCGMKVDSFYNWSFCGTCGRAVKWE